MHMTLHGGHILGPNGLHQGAVAVQDGRITGPDAAARQVDLGGLWVLPGLVDLHGDGFEHHLAPRRGAVADLGLGLRAAEAELASNGVTTAVLAQFFSWEGGMRGPDFAAAFVGALARCQAERRIDLHVQLRLETRLPGGYAQAEALIDRGAIRYVVFNDHVPHRALAAGKKPPRLTGQALKSGRSPEAHWDLLRHLHDLDIDADLAALAGRLRARGVVLGSHDDADGAVRRRMRALGATICEFPETLEAAQQARDGGDPVLMGAPNIMRGGSHTGKVAASELIQAGLCDALVSDYHYPSLMQAALRLAAQGLDLAQAWALVSVQPARILGLTDRGWLTEGRRADMIVLDPNSQRIEATISAGQIAYSSSVFAERALG